MKERELPRMEGKEWNPKPFLKERNLWERIFSGNGIGIMVQRVPLISPITRIKWKEG